MWNIFLADTNSRIRNTNPQNYGILSDSLHFLDIYVYFSSIRCIFNCITYKIHDNLLNLQRITIYICMLNFYISCYM